MKKLTLKLKTLCLSLLLCIFGATNILQAQKTINVSGYIEDEASAEKIMAATIMDTTSLQGTVSNQYGFFSLSIPKGKATTIRISFVGYETKFIEVPASEQDVSLSVYLVNGSALDEVEVSAQATSETIQENVRMSQISVPVEQIRQAPAILGEVDVVKVIQLLPGVQKGTEGSTGFYVRGGSADQNLILLDGVPVYNINHLFGFFSVFNIDAVRDVSFTKGGFPARFGGRLSSVLEINLKEGNMKKFAGALSVGLIAARGMFEGPIIKDKTSFLISFRRTYLDLLIKPFLLADSRNNGSDGGYYFHDINAKINHKFSDKDRLYLSVYGGDDRFYTNLKSGSGEINNNSLGWGNITSSLRWNHLFNSKMFSNFALNYTRFAFDIGLESRGSTGEGFKAGYMSGIEDIGVKADFDYALNNMHYLRFGANAVRHVFSPGAFNVRSSSQDTTVGNLAIPSGEYSIYGEDEWNVNGKLRLSLGVHGSLFHARGQVYGSVQPRLAGRYLLPNGVALKASFGTMTQYLHLLVNEGFGLPTDLWVPVTDRVKPQNAIQGSLGAAYTFKEQFEITLEAYYKKLDGVVSYREGAAFAGLGTWEDKIVQGQGESYGLELLIQKKLGKLTGWLGYTLSWNNRQQDEVNGGRWYPFKYDRRHDISLTASYRLGPKVRVSANWIFTSGHRYTLPDTRYTGANFASNPLSGNANFWNSNNDVSIFAQKNSYSFPNYHRLDFGFEFIKKWESKNGNPREYTFNCGAYNAYSRMNPFFAYQSSNNNGDPVLKLVSLFPVLPYFTFNWRWN